MLQQWRAPESLPLFAGLTGVVERLSARARIEETGPGVPLLAEGAPAERLYIPLDGLVALVAGGDEDEAVVQIVSPPEPFIVAAVLAGEPCLMSARTLGQARLYAIEAEAVRREAAASPELMGRLLGVLAGQFRMAVRQIKQLKLQNAARRVGGLLLRLIDENGGCAADLPVSKATLASRLGMSAETLSRSLAALREHGLAVNGSRAVVIDRDAVDRFCRPDPLIDGGEPQLMVTAL